MQDEIDNIVDAVHQAYIQATTNPFWIWKVSFWQVVVARAFIP
jgi:hypothetical protein